MKKNTVVFIDDEPLILEIYKKEFVRHGFKVFTATNPYDGLRLVKKHKPNIAFIDIIMPKMNGFSVLKKIKKSQKTKDVAVIMLTNFDSPESRRKCTQLGCLYFLVKPLLEPKDVVKLTKQAIAAQKTMKKKK